MPPSEEFLEKQAAEQGLMPIVPDEAAAYGYQSEDRHMVESFIRGETPTEDWRDGLLVTRLMMAAYMSSERGERMAFDPGALKGYSPKVASGEWDPKRRARGP